jgi:hypothetical protein
MKINISKTQAFWFGILFWFIQWLCIVWFEKNLDWWSEFYLSSSYPFFNNILLKIFSVFPFSVGDLCYFVLIILLVFHITKAIRSKGKTFVNQVVFWIWLSGFIHLFFHLSWGLNYLRVTEIEFSLTDEPYTAEELYAFSLELARRSEILHQRMCAKDSLLTTPFRPKQSPRQMYLDAFSTWNDVATTLPSEFKSVTHMSTKTSLYSTLLSFMGYSGYFNPFTHEAQVNINIPRYNMPTTILHEMSHQVGVADEGVANWLGFRASVLSKHEYFQYSGYTYALKYCFRNLHQLDEALAEQLKANISPGVWANFMETEQYFERYASPLEFVSKHFYDLFLKYNRQQDGIRGYNRLVDVLLKHPLPEFGH